MRRSSSDHPVLRSTVAGVLALLLAFAAASEPATMTVEDIQACIQQNRPRSSSVQRVLLRSVGRGGEASEARAQIFWKTFEDGLSKVLVRFSAPLDLRGSALLMLQRADGKPDMFTYLPELDRVRRVSTFMMSSSMFGTDFSYEEFERLYGLAQDASTRRLEDLELEGRAVYVIEARTGGAEGSAYDRILVYVEQERCVPLKTEFFGAGAEPLKVLTVDPAEVRRVQSSWVPNEIVMRDLHQGTETTLVVEEVEIDVEIPAKRFSERELTRGR